MVSYNFHCNVCNYKTGGKGQLLYHENVKHNICMICSQEFDSQLEFNNHFSQLHPDAPNFKCDKCDYQTIFKIRFLAHKRTAHRVSRQNSNNICNFCGSMNDLIMKIC